jgi:pre-mRNA cleavage complex 2 protein Pcf11
VLGGEFTNNDTISTNAATNNAASNPKLQYLPVPDDPILASSVCPICQEKFEMKWLDEAQEFVWMDAKMVGGRIYHASCHAEATKDVGAARERKGTPDPGSVLGKRKAEVSTFYDFA